ncbi:unnamed protein product [Diamesa tonsa]
MSSSSLCSYCYCIAGKPKCVKPKCMLRQAGCEPIYMESSSCCPIRYDCKNSNSTGLDINQVQEDFQRTNNKHYMRNNKRTHRSNGCFVDSYYYHEGQKLPMDQKRPCDVCYCIKGIRKCAPKQCAPAIRGCIPKVPRGDCCPISYDCKDSAELKDEHEDVKEVVQSTTLVPFKALGTTERSFFDFLRAGLEIIDANEDPINSILSLQANRTEDVDNLNSSEETVVTVAPRAPVTDSVKILEITSTTPVPTTQTSPTTARTTTIAVKTTQKPKPTTRETTTKRNEKPTTKVVPTTSKPSTTTATTKAPPTTTTVKTSTTTVTTTKKPVPVTTRKPATIKQVVTTLKPATTEKPKPKINTTNKIILTTTSVPKISSTIVQQQTTPKPQRTNQSSSEIITEEVKIPTKVTTVVSSTQSPLPMTTMKSQPVTTENIISAFFSGLSSIFDEQKKAEQVVGSKYALTPQPPINPNILSKQPSMNSNPSIIDTDYVYDYNEPTLPPSLPNLKIIPFLPADAVNNVNYFKPNLESRITPSYPAITEKYDVYGSIIRSDVLETDPTRLDYGGGYSNFNKDSQYNIYGSGLADPPLAVKGQSSDLLTDTYETPMKSQENIKQTGNGNNHVRYNTKFIRDKYDTVDYDFNPNEKIDKFEGELKYIPHSYEPNYSEYAKYPGNTGYPGASFEHDKYYTYSDKYDVAPDNTYVDKKPGFFSPPTKTEGGFIPKDSVKEDYYYNPGIEITTSEPGQIFDGNVLPPFKTAIYSDTPHTLHSLMEQKEKSNQMKNKTDDVEKKNNSRVTTDAPQVFAPQFVLNTANQTNMNSTSTSSSTNATEKDSKENNILPNVFNYLFTAESGGDINDNTLYTDNITNETIPAFKNISINFPSFDDWLSEQNNKTNATKEDSVKVPQQPSTVETTNVQKASEMSKVSPKTTRTPSTTSRIPTTKLTTKRPVKITTTTQRPTTTTQRPTTTTIKTTTISNIKKEVKYPVHSYVDPSIKELENVPVFNNQNKITNFDQMSQHHSEGATEISAKPTLPNMNGLLKLAGCNIYGRMYRVGKIIAELSSPCLECKCTEIGVSCTPLKC